MVFDALIPARRRQPECNGSYTGDERLYYAELRLRDNALHSDKWDDPEIDFIENFGREKKTGNNFETWLDADISVVDERFSVTFDINFVCPLMFHFRGLLVVFLRHALKQALRLFE